MKAEYQIEKKSEAYGKSQSDSNPLVQITLPMAEVLSYLEQGLGALVRKAGKIFIQSVLETP